MFTGIITEIGRIEKIIKSGNLIRLAVIAEALSLRSAVSDSISINGVCLTLIAKERNLLSFEVISSTLKATNLKRLKKGDYVNLEGALKVGDKLGGHFVLGHVDTELKLKRVIKKGNSWQLEIETPSVYKNYILPNGSITIDGISLTLKQSCLKSFTVDIIPFTFSNTTLKYKKSGDWLNIEFDYLLKKK